MIRRRSKICAIGSKPIAAKALRIIQLIEQMLRSPFTGPGKPEPLKFRLVGCWSRRIDREHRLVYKVESDTLVVLACRYHY